MDGVFFFFQQRVDNIDVERVQLLKRSFHFHLFLFYSLNECVINSFSFHFNRMASLPFQRILDLREENGRTISVVVEKSSFEEKPTDRSRLFSRKVSIESDR